MRGKGVLRILLAVAIFCTMATAVEAGSYNRNAAASYAYNNAYNDVPGSWYFGWSGDCTNFVSNALQAGGWTEIYGSNWMSSSVWFYNGPFGAQHSNSWSVSNDFFRFMYYSSRVTQVSNPDQLQIGDVIQIDYQDDRIWDHTMIITGKDSRGLLISQHSESRQNYPLSETYKRVNEQYPGKNHRYVGWHIKDSFSS